jgi:hypothetical protein
MLATDKAVIVMDTKLAISDVQTYILVKGKMSNFYSCSIF